MKKVVWVNCWVITKGINLKKGPLRAVLSVQSYPGLFVVSAPGRLLCVVLRVESWLCYLLALGLGKIAYLPEYPFLFLIMSCAEHVREGTIGVHCTQDEFSVPSTVLLGQNSLESQNSVGTLKDRLILLEKLVKYCGLNWAHISVRTGW